MLLRIVTYLGYFIGLLVAFQPSYIHPDEHFQSIEILIIRYFGKQGTVPWEYQLNNAARSYCPLLLFYGPLLYLLKNVVGTENPLTILYCVRLQNYIAYIVIINLTFQWLIPTPTTNRSKAKLFVMTSYITWSFQSHSFSNSIETIILLLVLATFQKQIQNPKDARSIIPLIQGVLISLGLFNRVTFPAFILLPSLKVFYSYYLYHLKQLLTLIFGFSFASYVFIHIDTNIYGGTGLVIAPLNNLLYNTKVSNLAEHGLHKRYTHLLINLPQLLGPAVLYLIPTSKKKFITTISSLAGLTILSTLLLLSLFPHQELRFLMPLTPFLCILLIRSNSKILIRIWILFNVALGAIMGIFHQCGIIKAITELKYFENQPVDVHIWWKTYSPPTWLYMNGNLTVSTTNFINNIERVDNVNFNVDKNHVIDLKGSDTELLEVTINEFLNNNDNTKISLFYPVSVQNRLRHLLSNNSLIFNEIYLTNWHLDLDHFDIDDLSTFKLGLSVIEISKKN